MPTVRIRRDDFLKDPRGVRFADVVNDPEQPFDAVLDFFSDGGRQRRMEESEIHHDRAPLAGVVRELESQPAIDRFLAEKPTRDCVRLRQAIGLLVRMIMEQRGWRKTGKKGSLGVRADRVEGLPSHNSGGLAFWFVRAERYEMEEGMPFQTVRDRNQTYRSSKSKTRRPRKSNGAPAKGKSK